MKIQILIASWLLLLSCTSGSDGGNEGSSRQKIEFFTHEGTEYAIGSTLARIGTFADNPVIFIYFLPQDASCDDITPTTNHLKVGFEEQGDGYGNAISLDVVLDSGTNLNLSRASGWDSQITSFDLTDQKIIEGWVTALDLGPDGDTSITGTFKASYCTS